MTDIDERLRSAPTRLSNIGPNAEALMSEAADVIKRQRAEIDRLNIALRCKESLQTEIERLRALLTELIDIEGPQPGTSEWASKVRAALESKP